MFCFVNKFSFFFQFICFFFIGKFDFKMIIVFKVWFFFNFFFQTRVYFLSFYCDVSFFPQKFELLLLNVRHLFLGENQSEKYLQTCNFLEYYPKTKGIVWSPWSHTRTALECHLHGIPYFIYLTASRFSTAKKSKKNWAKEHAWAILPNDWAKNGKS